MLCHLSLCHFPMLLAITSYNAKCLKDKGIAEICLQNGEILNKDEVIRMIENFDLNKSSKALKEILLPNGAKEIIDKILN